MEPLPDNAPTPNSDIALPTVEREAAFARVLARMQGREPPTVAAYGRYEFVRRLGAGGMGIVYLVHDPELDRQVALKVLNSAPAEDPDSEAKDRQQRIRREARAMARLDHPNVVRVLDVGEHEGRTYLAMEYVEGGTLREWLAATPRGWRAIVTAFLAAGTGLAAAHEAGLVHCDFKPDNVLMGPAGAIKVSDFGLVRGQDADPGETLDTRESGTTTRAQLSTLTGSVGGTPAFMAPEQFRGQRGDARSDQFSFCVALYRALHGRPPFPGTSAERLRESVLAGLDARAQQRHNRQLPRALHHAILRGLSTDPAQRWPTLRILLDQLQRALDQRKRRVRGAALGLTLASLAGLAGARVTSHYARTQQQQACLAEGDAVDELWTPERRQLLRESFEARPGYAEVSAWIVGSVDERVESWRDARRRSCIDAKLERAWSEQQYTRAQACFDEQSTQLDALLDALARPDAELEHATQAIASLPDGDRCRDLRRLDALPPPPDQPERVAELSAKLAQARALSSTGDTARAQELAEQALAQAEALEWTPPIARAHMLLATSYSKRGEHPQAEAELELAYFEAKRAGLEELALHAALRLSVEVGYYQRRYAEGRRWATHAEVLFDSQPAHEAELLRAEHDSHLGAIAYAEGQFERALELHARTLEVRERVLGPDHHLVAATLDDLASAHEGLGQADQALPLAERAFESSLADFGPDHPETAYARQHLAVVLAALGRYRDAREQLYLALDALELTLEPDSPNIADVLDSAATVDIRLGETARVRELLERAIAIRERAFGPDSEQVASTLINLGAQLDTSGDPEAAAPVLERALRIRESSPQTSPLDLADTLNSLAVVHTRIGAYAAAQGELERALKLSEEAGYGEHPTTGLFWTSLGETHQAAGAVQPAIEAYTRGLEIIEAALGDHPILGFPLTGLAELALVDARPAEALQLAERARELRGQGATPAELAQTHFALARAHAALGDAARARAQAELALRHYQDAEDPRASEVEAFLAARN